MSRIARLHFGAFAVSLTPYHSEYSKTETVPGSSPLLDSR